MGKIILTGIFLLVALLIPTSTFAEDQMQTTQSSTTQVRSDIRHAYKPVTVRENNWVRARVQNVTTASKDNLVCVEAMKGSSKTHLGCLRVQLSAMNTKTEDGMDWTKEFDAPTNRLGAGNWQVTYTYQDENGMWQGIKGMNGQVLNGSVTR
jgi:hypothetical protein